MIRSLGPIWKHWCVAFTCAHSLEILLAKHFWFTPKVRTAPEYLQAKHSSSFPLQPFLQRRRFLISVIFFCTANQHTHSERYVFSMHFFHCYFRSTLYFKLLNEISIWNNNPVDVVDIRHFLMNKGHHDGSWCCKSLGMFWWIKDRLNDKLQL
jgi:hypothetical protein